MPIPTVFTANTNFDIYVHSTGSDSIGVYAQAWTDDNTPPPRDYFNGRWVDATDHSSNLIGSIRITSTPHISSDNDMLRYLHNIYNQIQRSHRYDFSSSWVYAAASWRYVNSLQDQIKTIFTTSGQRIDLTATMIAHANSATSEPVFAITMDSSNPISQGGGMGYGRVAAPIGAEIPISFRSFIKTGAGHRQINVIEYALGSVQYQGRGTLGTGGDNSSLIGYSFG